MDQSAKIYVSGHRGMIGSAMVKRLALDGYTNIITRTHGELDLSRQADVEHFFEQERPEYVFHIAAKAGGVMDNKKYPTEYLTEGTYIALNVLNAAHQFDAKGVVYVSSANVYPENAPQPMKEELFLSGRAPYIFEGYAISKAVGMKFCESVHRQFGKRFIPAVLGAVYGLNDHGTTVTPMLMDKFAKAVLCHEPYVEIWGTGNSVREFTNSADVCDALLFLMDHYEGGAPINVSSGDECSIREYAGLLQEISCFEGELVFDTSKPDSAKRISLDTTKLRTLGWNPTMSLTDGLRGVYKEHLQWMKEKL